MKKLQFAFFSWPCVFAVWQRSIYVYRRTFFMNILPNFFEPLIYLFGLGYGLGGFVGNISGHENYATFLAPGLIVANAMNGSSFETTYNLFVKMHLNHTYQAIIATPVTMTDAMWGEILWAVTRGTLYGVIFTLVNVVIGLLSWLTLLKLLPTIVLTAWLFASLGMLFTSFIAVIDMYAFFYTLFLTPLFLCSGIFFPLQNLSIWVQNLAYLSPLFHCVRLAHLAAANPAVTIPWNIVLTDTVCILSLALLCCTIAIARIEAAASG